MRFLLAITLLFALAAPAGAAPVTAGTDADAVGPLRLYGDGVIWVSTPRHAIALAPAGSWPVVLRHGRPGQPLGSFGKVGSLSSDGYYGSSVTVDELDVSGGHAALSTISSDSAASKYTGNGTVGSGVSVMDLASRASTSLLSCGVDGRAAGAMAWPYAAFQGCGGAVQVRDLSQPAAAPVALTGAGGRIRMAGTMVAFHASGGYVVHDVASGADVLSIPDSALPGAVHAIDVQSDGKLAVATGKAPVFGGGAVDATQIVWASPADPAPKVVAPGPAFRGLRMAGDRFAFLRLGAASDELVVRDLQGVDTIVARFDAAGPFDFDGTRAAWARRTCDATEVMMRPAAEQPADEHRIDVCPLEVEDQRPEVSRRGRLKVFAYCPQLVPAQGADTCRVAASLRANGKGLATASARIKAGAYRSIAFTLPARTLRSRPRKIILTAANTMRSGPEDTAAVLRPFYPRRR
jgi:hypothetical protein